MTSVSARDRALERVHHVWIAALISGALGTAIFLWIGINTGEWMEGLVYLVSSVLSVSLAWLVLRRHSRVAAGILLLNAIVTPVIQFIIAGHISNVVVAGVLAYVYFRGLQATMDLAEMPDDSKAPAV